MSNQYSNEPMLDMFIFETNQLITNLEQIILESEKGNCFSVEDIREIFRIMHTIKGSAAMMMFSNISTLAHAMEDIFYYLREENPRVVDFLTLSDLALESIDFIKVQIEKIKNNEDDREDASKLIESLKGFLSELIEQNDFNGEVNLDDSPKVKQQYYISKDKIIPVSYHNAYKVVIRFEEGCEMENIRAYSIVHKIKDITNEFYYFPTDIIENDKSTECIRKDGFCILLKSDWHYEKMYSFFIQTIFLKSLELIQIENDDEFQRLLNESQYLIDENERVVRKNSIEVQNTKNRSKTETVTQPASSSIISVQVEKLDKLMDLVGEMVIAESMVVQNPDLKGLELDNFQKSARQLNKITNEIQDIVMSIRMVPLAATFLKMQRVVRDMCKKLGKEVMLEILGEETEVDKNIIEHISDPLMHLVRNAIDHGIEDKKERVSKGKEAVGILTLEAKNIGNDVLITVKDDGKGLDKDKIFNKAREHGLVSRSKEEMTEKEIFNLILLAGFSTKENVSEFSGRGVGMDVVTKNIETLGGFVTVDSVLGEGTTITLKIPLTLAIIDGMTIKVGRSFYTLPTISIKESFRPKLSDIITDPEGNEMIMVRGSCYPVLRLHKVYKLQTDITNFTDGIIIMVEHDDKTLCIFADKLLGQQQVVVKVLPKYIQRFKKVKGLAGCTLLGDGSISLILDIAALVR
jgi:two-component system chemotaxis sensor kinase CheA